MAELKNLKKGDVVILRMFTGIAVAKKEVIASDAKTVTLETWRGKAKFSKKTGIQVEPMAKSERFANYITEDDGSFEKEVAERNAKKKAKKTTKSSKKTKKDEEATSKKSTKKEPDPVPDDEDDFDEDDYEEID